MASKLHSYIQLYRLDYLTYIFCVITLYMLAYSNLFTPNFIYIPIILACAPLAWNALQALRKKQIGNDFFLVFATLFSLAGNQEAAIMIILIIMLFAHYAELLIQRQTKHALESIIKLIPSTVIIIKNNKESIVPLDQVVHGMDIIVKTGARIPVDGIIIEGAASINESALTGESFPKEKTKGAMVFAGTFIEAGSITVTTERVSTETLFGKMTSLLLEAEQNKAQITIITERIVTFIVPFYLVHDKLTIDNSSLF